MSGAAERLTAKMIEWGLKNPCVQTRPRTPDPAKQRPGLYTYIATWVTDEGKESALQNDDPERLESLLADVVAQDSIYNVMLKRVTEYLMMTVGPHWRQDMTSGHLPALVAHAAKIIVQTVREEQEALVRRIEKLERDVARLKEEREAGERQ